MFRFRLAIILAALSLTAPAHAARCGGDFQTFVSAMSQEAQAAGISQSVISQAFAGVTQDPAVLSFDRRQRGTFRQSFEQYTATRVTQGRITRGRQMLQRHAPLLARIQQQYGVWFFGNRFGKQSTLIKSDITRRCADQPTHGMTLHIF